MAVNPVVVVETEETKKVVSQTTPSSAKSPLGMVILLSTVGKNSTKILKLLVSTLVTLISPLGNNGTCPLVTMCGTDKLFLLGMLLHLHQLLASLLPMLCPPSPIPGFLIQGILIISQMMSKIFNRSHLLKIIIRFAYAMSKVFIFILLALLHFLPLYTLTHTSHLRIFF